MNTYITTFGISSASSFIYQYVPWLFPSTQVTTLSRRSTIIKRSYPRYNDFVNESTTSTSQNSSPQIKPHLSNFISKMYVSHPFLQSQGHTCRTGDLVVRFALVCAFISSIALFICILVLLQEFCNWSEEERRVREQRRVRAQRRRERRRGLEAQEYHEDYSIRDEKEFILRDKDGCKCSTISPLGLDSSGLIRGLEHD